jgi:hypothetical protein
MTGNQNPNRLHSHLAHMIAFESTIEHRLEELIHEVSAHNEVSELLTNIQALSRGQRQALDARLQTRASGEPASIGTMNVVSGVWVSYAVQPITTSLQEVYTMLNQAVFGYSVLHTLATRFLDSVMVAEDGTSQHLARQHTQSYIRVIQQISSLLHDVVIWELDQESHECQCTCPSCGIGICLCALAGRSFLRDAWVEAGPIADDKGVFVQLPKQDSAAANAGLHRGTIILAVGGQEIESWRDLQEAVWETQPGEEIRLMVQFDGQVSEEVAILLPKE